MGRRWSTRGTPRGRWTGINTLNLSFLGWFYTTRVCQRWHTLVVENHPRNEPTLAYVCRIPIYDCRQGLYDTATYYNYSYYYPRPSAHSTS